MDYVRFGRSGLKVSRVCLGTLTFGREADEATSHAILDRFWEMGGMFIDTANSYGKGASEEVVGRWLKDRGVRDRVVLTTKVSNTVGSGPNEGGLSRIHIMQAIEASLRRLQTDVIDLYQLHHWSPESPMEETLQAFDDLVRQGKVRYVGCSNLPAWRLSKYLHISDLRDWSRFISLQPIYNALNRGIEMELLPLCEQEGLGVLTYNPLAGGMLTGKYQGGELPAGTRLASVPYYKDRYLTGEAHDIVERFGHAARDRGVSPAQLAIAWILAEPRVTCPILGARNLEQLNDTLGGLDIALSPEERASLPAVASGRWVGVDPVYDKEM